MFQSGPVCFHRLLLPICLFAAWTLWQTPLLAQSGNADYARLVHPEVAEMLSLDDQQRVALQTLLQNRTALRVAEPTDETKQQLAQNEQQIRETLTAAQLDSFLNATPNSDLRFQFRDQAWADVLDWFARQEGLTLVMDRAPPGTFSYTDDRGYTSTEAIDLLNSVLLTRDYTLVRREKMLTLLQLSESIPIELIPRISLEELPSRGRFELVSVLFPLGTRPVDAVMTEVKGYLGSYGRAIPLPQSKQLLVVESAGKMETINVLIQSVPEPQIPAAPQPPAKPPEPVFAAYPLGNLDPEVTLELIRELVGSERVTVDRETRLLTAYVVPGQQQAIQGAIEQMRQTSDVTPAPTSVAYPIDPADEVALSAQIVAIAPRAVVTMDAIGRKLLVTAGEQEQLAIRTALSNLGVTTDEANREVRSYSVESTEAVTLAAALQQMLPNAQTVGNATLGTIVVRGSQQDLALADEVYRRWRGEDGYQEKIVHAFPLDRQANAQWLETVTKVVPKAQVWLDDDGQRLMLLGSAADKTSLDAMLPQLLTSIAEPLNLILRTYELTGDQLARWNQLQPTLSVELTDTQIIPQAAADGVPAKLLVWGPQKSQTRIADLLPQLAEQPGDSPPTLPKKYRIDVQETELVTALLRDRYPDLRITDSTDGKSVTVWAGDETQQAVAQLLAAFQAELTPRTELSWESYSSPTMTPLELQTVLQPMLTQLASDGKITLDATAGRLLIWAEPDVHKRLTELIQELGEARSADRTPILLAYTLEHADAAGVKTLLDATLTGATVVADTSRRQLVVTATLEQQGRVKSILAELDREQSAAGIKEIRSYTLRSVQGTPLLPTLQSLFPAMQLSVDATSNQIIALGTDREHQSLRQAIERLQTSEDGGETRVETYTLAAGDLRTLPTVLTQLAPRAVISPDIASGTIVVWGSDEDHQRIGQAIEQLSAAVSERQQLSVFQVRPDQLLGLQTSLRTLFPTASVAVETAAGRLTVLAPKSIAQQIDQFVEQTLAAEAEAVKPEPQAYKIDVKLRTPFATLLTSAVPRATLISSAIGSDQPTIILAFPEDHMRIAKLLENLTAQLVSDSEQEVRVYALGKIAPLAFSSLLAERRPAAKMVAGTGTDQPLVSDTPAGHEELGRLLEQLRLAYEQSPERSLRVFEVRKDLLTSARTGLAGFAPKATLLPTLAPDRLVVQATEEDLEKIAAWLQDMQNKVQPPLESISRVYPLTNADPTTAVRMLQVLLPEALFAADVTTGSVGATATDDEHVRVAELVEQLNNTEAKTESLKAYRLQQADPTVVVETLQQAFGPRSTTGVSFDPKSGVVFVVGLPEQQRIAASLIEEMDVAQPETARRLKVFTTAGISGSDLDETLADLLTDSRPPADIEFDYLNDRLVVVATDGQLMLIEEVLGELQPPERTLEIFPLRQSEPESIRFAIDALFEDLSFNAAPTITIDEDRGQLLIRATPEQISEIRNLLDRLGEGTVAGTDATDTDATGNRATGEFGRGSKARVRTVLVGRRSDQLLQQLRQVWPTLSAAPLRIIDPNTLRPGETDRPDEKPAEKPAANDGAAFDAKPSIPAGIPAGPDVQLVSTQIQPPAESQTPDSQPSADPEPSAVVILPDGDRWTLASSDPVALEILATWIENVVAPPLSVVETSGNRSVFLLEHAAADDLQSILSDLFITQRGTARAGTGRTGTRDPNTRIVADERINAIIVQGSTVDRRAIEELLTVLDSPEFVGMLQAQPAEIVPLKNTSADRVLLLLNKLYATEQSASSGRSKISIPTGISEDVAELLEQINALASVPLLTLGVDDVTNAIVMRAPRELADEVRDFISQVDQQAATGSPSRLRIIPLRDSKSEQILKTLELLKIGR